MIVLVPQRQIFLQPALFQRIGACWDKNCKATEAQEPLPLAPKKRCAEAKQATQQVLSGLLLLLPYAQPLIVFIVDDPGRVGRRDGRLAGGNIVRLAHLGSGKQSRDFIDRLIAFRRDRILSLE